MKGNYRTFFSFDVDILKEARTRVVDGSFLRSDEVSFEEIGYRRYQQERVQPCTPAGDEKENVSGVCQKRAFGDLSNKGEAGARASLDSKRISILEAVSDEKSELVVVCEEVESLSLSSSQNENTLNSLARQSGPGSSLFKLGTCGNFDRSEEGTTLRSEDSYYLVSMFSAVRQGPGRDLAGYEKALFSMGLVSTMNPYHVRSRSFRESIMLNCINERFNNYSKLLQTCSIPYMLYQINLASAVNRADAPKMSQASFKTGYSFTLEISQGCKRIFMLKKLIGSGANASVFSSDVCTMLNEKLVEVFSCAVKVQHKDIGLNIREIYCGLSLYKRNKKRTSVKSNRKSLSETEKQSAPSENQASNSKDAFKAGSPGIQKTARSSVSTTYLPGSNVPSSRNSVNSLSACAEAPEESRASENTAYTSSQSYHHPMNVPATGLQLSSTNTPLSSLRRSSVSSARTGGRGSISSSYSCNYADSPPEGSNPLIEPIEIGNGVTVFCITELCIVSQSSSGMIQNILTREMMKGNREQEKKQRGQADEDPGASVGISILPTSFGSQSLQNVLNEHYLSNGTTMEEPILLFLAYQFAETLLAFNEMGILHGDIKPDNILLYPNPSFGDEGWSCRPGTPAGHPLIPENLQLPICMSIIDFGRSLDIGEIYKNTFFEGNCHAKGFLPPVMLENLPWLHHIDIFGIASTMHCLITGRYMELTKWSDETLRCLEHGFANSSRDGGDILKVYNYRIKNQSSCLKRRWKIEFWSSFMASCINFCPILHAQSLPNANQLQSSVSYDDNVGPASERTKSLHVSQSIDEISHNVCIFLKKLQADVVSIFHEDMQLKTLLYYQLLKIRKQLQDASPSN